MTISPKDMRDAGQRKRQSRATASKTKVPKSPTLLAALDAVTKFIEAPAHRRREIERTVDALIVLLDCLDGDPDLELDDDRCEALEDYGGLPISGDWRAGHPEDAEDIGDAEESEPTDFIPGLTEGAEESARGQSRDRSDESFEDLLNAW